MAGRFKPENSLYFKLMVNAGITDSKNGCEGKDYSRPAA
jgi:hypothetical protein